MTAPHLLFDAYAVSLAIGAVLALAVAMTAWKRRAAPGALPLGLLALASAWWIGCELSSWLLGPPAGDRLFWYRSAFAGVVVTVPAFFLFALEYTERANWITRTRILLLTVEPLLFNLAVWTDPHHGLVFAGWRGRDTGVFVGGAAFWLHSGYSYLLFGSALVLLVRGFMHAAPLYRAQAAMISAAALVPFVGNALTIFRISPFPGRDLTSFGLVISSAAIAAALFGRGLLELVPIARAAVVDLMHDGVLVLDRSHRIIDLNPAARSILQLDGQAVLGQPATQALAAWPQFSTAYLDAVDFHQEMTIDPERIVDVRISALTDRRGALRGRVVVLRDITPLREASAALQEANRKLQEQLTEIESMQGLLREQAMRDALTGLYNRRFFEETLRRELAHAERSGEQMSLALIDLDHFKQVNDRHGHLAGDRVLQSLAALLTARSRAGDAVCRFGGEEFVVILPGASLASAVERVETWRTEFMASPTRVGDSEVRVTLSAGVASFPQHGRVGDTLIQAADMALYAAKAGKRNRVVAATAV